MTYASGQLITTAEYNNFVGPSVGTSNNALNTVWATGNGQYGYGQTAVSQSATSAGLVTATQWASLINTINAANRHQSNAATALTVPTSATLNIAQSGLQGAINTLYNNHLLYGAGQGSNVAGSSYTPNLSVGNTYAAQSLSITRAITFSASTDAMRYFFNAGGQIQIVMSGSGSGSTRSTDLAGCITSIGTITFGALSNSGRSGSGNSQTTNNTGYGYFNCGASGSFLGGTSISQITSTAYTYTGDYAQVAIRTNGTQGSNGDVGTVFYIDMYLYAAAHNSNNLFNQTINTTWTHQVNIIYPESTYLTNNSWGTVGSTIVVS